MKVKVFCAIFLIILVSIEEGDFATTVAPEKCEEKDCEKKACQPGFWGEPCKKCECFGRADECDYATGNCLCTSKGVMGPNCDQCDEKKQFKGDAVNGKCYYDVFNSNFFMKLNSPSNKHVKHLNLKFAPEVPKENVVFWMNCTENCSPFELTMVAKEGGKDPKVLIDKQKMNGNDMFEKILSHNDFKFGMDKDKPATEFFVHIDCLQTPTIFNVKAVPESKKNDEFIAFYVS